MTKKEGGAAGKKLADPAPGSDYFVSEIKKKLYFVFTSHFI